MFRELCTGGSSCTLDGSKRAYNTNYSSLIILFDLLLVIIQTLHRKFDVFLTVHHSIDFSKYQLSAQFF